MYRFTGTTVKAIEDFPLILESFSSIAKESKLEGTLRKIKKVRNENPMAYTEKTIGQYLRNRSNILQDLVKSYLSDSISKEFPLVAPEMFELERYLTLEKDRNKYKIIRDGTTKDEMEIDRKDRGKFKKLSVPLFAYVSLDDPSEKFELGKITSSRNVSHRGSRETTTIKIEAKLPGSIDPSVKDASRHALSVYFKSVGEALSIPNIGDLVLEYNQLEELTPEMVVTWIPTAKSLNVSTKKEIINKEREIDRDPALILTALGNDYLIKTWNIEDEEPFEGHLRKFTGKGIDKILRKK